MTSALLHEHRFDSREEAAQTLAEKVGQLLQQGYGMRGSASLAVPGGKTPADFLSRLGRMELRWSSVWITLTDERWVGAEDDQSNQRLLRSTLLRGPGGRAHFVPFVTDAGDVESDRQLTEEALEKLPAPFDVVVLGMGEDGHTASLFPSAKELHDLMSPPPGKLCGSTCLTDKAQPRLSLTLPTLLNSRQIFLLITGDAKWASYRHAAADGEIDEMPVRAILRQPEVPVDVYWGP